MGDRLLLRRRFQQKESECQAEVEEEAEGSREEDDDEEEEEEEEEEAKECSKFFLSPSPLFLLSLFCSVFPSSPLSDLQFGPRFEKGLPATTMKSDYLVTAA